MQELKPSTVGFRRKGDPTIRVNRKSGMLQFSRGAVERLGVNVGDQVTFLIDAPTKKVYIIKCEDGWKVKSYKETQLLIQSVALANLLNDSVRKDDVSVKFLVAVKSNVDGKMVHELIPMR